MTSLLVIVALLSAVLVFRAERRRDVPAAFLWALAVFLFWIVALPVYLWQRSTKTRLAATMLHQQALPAERDGHNP